MGAKKENNGCPVLWTFFKTGCVKDLQIVLGLQYTVFVKFAEAQTAHIFCRLMKFTVFA